MVYKYKVNIKWFSHITGEPIKEDAEYFGTLDEARDLALGLHEGYLADPKATAHEVLVFRIPERGPSLRLLQYTEETEAPATHTG